MSNSDNLGTSRAISSQDGSSWTAARNGLNTLAHTLVGGHVPLVRHAYCHPGSAVRISYYYQLLMTEGILCFASGNGWSNPLKLKHKRLVHWVLQLLGSVLALAGSVTMMAAHSPFNFRSTHGILGLVAAIFTVISLINGLASLYVYKLRRFLSGDFIKAGHIFSSTAAFVFATACLCYGFDKSSFKSWVSPEFAYVLMAFSGIFTLIAIVNPLISFSSRLKNMAT